MTQTEFEVSNFDFTSQMIIKQTIMDDLVLIGRPYGFTDADALHTHTPIRSNHNPNITAVGAYLIKPIQDFKQPLGGIYLFNKKDDVWVFAQKIMFGELSKYNVYFGERLSFNSKGTVISILPSGLTTVYQTQGYPILKHHVEYELYENSWRLCRYNCL